MFKIIFGCLKKERIVLAASLLIGCSAAIFHSAVAYSDSIQGGISDEVLRLHVLANSDEEKDQELKIKVKDAIVEELREELAASKTKEETRRLLLKNMNRVVSTAERVIHENGFDYTVSAGLSRSIFPTKYYADVRLPAGEYEALRVEIGQAAGQNWWCVMFPPLCFVDVTQSELSEEDKAELKEILTEEEYELVTNPEGELEPEIKFKIVEWMQERKYQDEVYAKEAEAKEAFLVTELKSFTEGSEGFTKDYNKSEDSYGWSKKALTVLK